jgi:hypothetical protein
MPREKRICRELDIMARCVVYGADTILQGTHRRPLGDALIRAEGRFDDNAAYRSRFPHRTFRSQGTFALFAPARRQDEPHREHHAAQDGWPQVSEAEISDRRVNAYCRTEPDKAGNGQRLPQRRCGTGIS